MHINPFILIKNESSEVYLPLKKKKRRYMSSEGCAAHPVGHKSPHQIKMPFGALFFLFELARGSWV